MNKVFLAVAMATVFAGTACATEERAANGNVCLPTFEIKQTVVAPDERSITFQMKDGKSWINTLPAQCRGLNLHGFTYTSRTINQVCAGQGIQLVQTGTVCQLGQFVEAPPKGGTN